MLIIKIVISRKHNFLNLIPTLLFPLAFHPVLDQFKVLLQSFQYLLALLKKITINWHMDIFNGLINK
jgi:hypothetical protein